MGVRVRVRVRVRLIEIEKCDGRELKMLTLKDLKRLKNEIEVNK